jgi:hypothetical protein
MNRRADMPSDLPRRRAAPLGWTFALAFVVHGAMPGGGLIAASIALIPAPWMYPAVGLSIVVTFLGAGLVVASALRARSQIQALREVDALGVWAGAVVVDQKVGMSTSRGSEDGQRRAFKHVTLRLRIQPPQGAPYEIEHGAHFTFDEMEHLHPGAPLHVKVLPADPTRVLVYPPTPPEPTAQAPSPPGLAMHV